ncbi:trehalose-phosphatase [Trichlorobacter lovleyi]|uniref:trehalose-phosphatase n=1 Tax=Trichlorobacter lovleyi TaxID=313985 RepID=UPI00223EAB3C|nr:trehalose-phosphatase [Trichlorobacter lovleyi]QOX78857.1 trehalose-phosphatase [Trichlorobacter lovleyi]
MNDIFTKAGLGALQGFITPQTLIAFDLDGTLAPINPDPHMIEVSGELQQELRMIMQYLPVAVITGRSRRDAMRFFEFAPSHLIGNHGAEGLPVWKAAEARFKELVQSWKMQLLQRLETSDVGILLEDKGASLSVHYRHAPDQEQVATRLHDIITTLTPPPRVVDGKCVLNLVPQDAPNKGDALLELMTQTGRDQAIFVGDDVTDEDVFALGSRNIFSIRVGKNDTSQADWYLSEQAGVLKLVQEMHSFLHN